MGLLDSFSGLVTLKYKVDAKEAVKDIQNLSKEQKKAAKEQSDALKRQSEDAQSLGEKYAKTAAVIIGVYTAAKVGLDALRKESRLSAGAVGVDIEKLEEAAGGMKTRWELMSIAQAGHQGALKLTTQQIGYVIEGMRALEKKGFDAKEAQDELTKALIEGKLEGLDKFGLGLKTTGDRTKDTQTLMRALRDEVRDVGGEFGRTGDAAERSAVTIHNVLAKIQVWLGQATQASLDFAESVGKWAGRQIYGDLPEGGQRTDPAALADSARRFALAAQVASGQDPAGHTRALLQYNQGRLDQLATGSTFSQIQGSAADMAAAQQAERLVTDIRAGIYKKLGPEALAEEVKKLPEAWNLARPDLKRLVDDQFAYLETAWTGRAHDLALELAGSFKVAFGDMQADIRESRRARGGSAGGSRSSAGLPIGVTSETFDASIPKGRLYNTATDPAAERRTQIERETAAYKQAMLELADVDRQLKYDDEQAAKAAQKSHLERMFGPLSEFDAYAEGFRTLTDAVRASGDAILDSVIKGEKLTKASAGRAVAAILGAESHKLWGLGLSTELQGIATLNPAMMAAGAAEIAGAFALGRIAQSFGGGGAAGGGRSSGPRPALSSGGGASGPTMSTTVIFGDSNSDDSPYYRARQTRAALDRAGQVAPPAGVRHG